ncbi:MAG: DUF349 domain-containing protein [Flavobacteriales bacterium]|jgi:hypothetical protein|nr:DUF349 domain-containing protein [Flavobacteriales bacterium]
MEEQNIPVGQMSEDNNNKVVLTKEEKFNNFVESNWKTPEEFSNREILEALRKMNSEVALSFQKPIYEKANNILSERMNKAKEEAFEKFVEDGGKPEEFRFQDLDYLSYRDLYKNYKKQRETERAAFEKNLQDNLAKKEALIEELKTIVDSGENIAYDTFKRINEDWKAAGWVPQEKSEYIFNTFHHHANRFFDLMSVNKDLRDIEFKRNLEIKTALCEKAEALLGKEDIISAINELQTLHQEWKQNNGPLARESREDIWNRFSEATNKLHDKRTAYYEQQKEQFDLNFQKKLAIVEKVKNMDYDAISSHQKWQDAIKVLNSFREEYKTTGRVTQAQNDEAWGLFKEAVQEFNRKKNNYYKDFKQKQKEALDIKYDLLKKAEEIKDSQDWRATSEKLKSLQVQWKKTPRPLLKEADDVWGKFRAACNHFFNNMTAHYDALKGDMVENLKNKETILGELENFSLNTENPSQENFTLLKDFNKRWKDAGMVSREDHKRVEGVFRSKMDTLFSQLRMEESEKRDMMFKMKIDAWIQEDDQRAISKERQFIRKKIDGLNNDINNFERNMEWFSGKSSEKMKNDIQKKIDKARGQIKQYRQNLKMLNEIAE